MSMFADTTYAKTMTVAKKLLNVYGLRAEVIADNIANVSTPNFKRSDVTFEYQLGRALDSEKYNGLEAKRTDARHFPFNMPMDYREVAPTITIDFDTMEDESVTIRHRDSMEQERVKISELETYIAKSLEF